MRSIWKIIFFIASHEFRTCDSQEKPRYTLPKFSNETVRQNLCDIHRLVESGKIERRDALRGMDLHPVLFPYQLNEETGAIDEANPDIAIDFLDELARRAGFQWRDSYGLTNTPENETWTELLLWAGGKYDLVAEWFVKTEDRVADGALISEGWYDAGLIMVKKADEEAGRDFFNFLRPFTYGLWVLIGITLLVTGLVYFLLDYLDSRRYAAEIDLDFQASMFNAAWTFTGHSLHEPKSTATRFVVFSLSFLCLMIVTAYTANLASFLVTKNANKMEINGINDVIKHDLRCCIDPNGPYNEFMEKNYPTAKLVPIIEQGWGHEIYHALARSECDLILTDAGTFEMRKRSEEFNPHCDLEWVGRKVYDMTGDFPVLDSVNLCSSLLSDVLAIHMLEMKNDETFYDIWEKYLSRTDTGFCTTTKGESENTDKLGVHNMFGIFVLYFAVTFLAIMWSICQCYRAQIQKDVTSSMMRSMDSLKRKDSTASNQASAQELTLSSTARNIGQKNPSTDWQGVELVDTKSFPPPSEECKENTSLQHQKFWDKLLEIEKGKDDLRELRELFEKDRHEQSQRDKELKKSLTFLKKQMIEMQGEHTDIF